MDEDISGNIRINSDITPEDKRTILQALKRKYPAFKLSDSSIVNLTQEAEKRVLTLFEQGWVLKNHSYEYETPYYMLLPPDRDERLRYGAYYVSVPFNDILVSVPHYALLRNAGASRDNATSVRSSCSLF